MNNNRSPEASSGIPAGLLTPQSLSGPRALGVRVLIAGVMLMGVAWGADTPTTGPTTAVVNRGGVALDKGDLVLELAKGVPVPFMEIKPGTFEMGSPKTEKERDDDETQHTVTLTKGYYLGKCEVTVGQFKAFVEATGHKTDAERDERGGWGWDGRQPAQGPKYSWRNTGVPQGHTYPVLNVSWNDAVAFCQWASKATGRTVRLPTEAEWEYACRAGTQTRFAWGDALADGRGWLNGADLSCREAVSAVAVKTVETFAAQAKAEPWFAFDDGHGATAPVGTYRANAWGLHDMHGNAQEWCSDGYAPYGTEAVRDPQGAAMGALVRVLRGGCWFGEPRRCRSAERNGDVPGSRNRSIGFRVVADRGVMGVASGADVPTSGPTTVVVNRGGIALDKGDLVLELAKGVPVPFIEIKPGTFEMGSPKTEKERFDDEVQHTVTLTKGYYLGKCEVTVGQFKAFVDATGYKTDAERDGSGGWGWESGKPSQGLKYFWWNTGFPQDDKHPVVNVSWNDAMAFCQWASKATGRSVRLPTEAEWEYACRAGTQTRFVWGDASADGRGWLNGGDLSNKKARAADAVRDWEAFAEKQKLEPWLPFDDEYAFTAPVGAYRANAWGLHDMHGNAAEWCSDGYAPYSTEAVKDPQGDEKAVARVLRGGSWFYVPRICRSAVRVRIDPARRSANSGVRLAVDLK